MTAEKSPARTSILVPVCIAAVAITLRAFAFLRMSESPRFLHGDPEFYLKITQGFLEGRWAPDVWIFPPGYPLLALPFATVIGAGWSVLLVSALAGIALPLFLLAARRHVAHPERAAWAALVVAVFPEAVYSTARALSEASTLLTIVAMIAFFEASERAATSRGRRLAASAAGAAGGMSALARPETAPCFLLLAAFAALFPSRAKKRESRESSLWIVATALVVMAPYMLALHERSGVWALSLKTQLNVQKTLVQEGGGTFVERRALWDEYFETKLLRDGVIDPRRIAEGVDLGHYFRTRWTPAFYFENLKFALGKRALLENVLVALGLLGLVAAAREGGRSRREAALAAITAVPFLVVPVLFPPMERYGLVALPAFAWGTGVVLAACVSRLRGRFGARASSAALVAFVLVIVIPATVAVERNTRDVRWKGRGLEFQVAMSKGDLATAEAIVGEGIEVDAKNPAVHLALGDLRARRGDAAGALASYEESLRLGGDRIEIAFALGSLGEFDAANRALEPLRRSPPNDADYWTIEGHLAAARGDVHAANAAYDRAEQAGADPAKLEPGRREALLRATK